MNSSHPQLERPHLPVPCSSLFQPPHKTASEPQLIIERISQRLPVPLGIANLWFRPTRTNSPPRAPTSFSCSTTTAQGPALSSVWQQRQRHDLPLAAAPAGKLASVATLAVWNTMNSTPDFVLCRKAIHPSLYNNRVGTWDDPILGKILFALPVQLCAHITNQICLCPPGKQISGDEKSFTAFGARIWTHYVKCDGFEWLSWQPRLLWSIAVCSPWLPDVAHDYLTGLNFTGVPFSDCLALNADNAPVMVGKNCRVASVLKQEMPNLPAVVHWCWPVNLACWSAGVHRYWLTLGLTDWDPPKPQISSAMRCVFSTQGWFVDWKGWSPEAVGGLCLLQRAEVLESGGEGFSSDWYLDIVSAHFTLLWIPLRREKGIRSELLQSGLAKVEQVTWWSYSGLLSRTVSDNPVLSPSLSTRTRIAVGTESWVSRADYPNTPGDVLLPAPEARWKEQTDKVTPWGWVPRARSLPFYTLGCIERVAVQGVGFHWRVLGVRIKFLVTCCVLTGLTSMR
ncbi:hypothetical protein PR048_010286 [Dryococelus australis]|uniref:Reverse transcriptase n=1 Tax=Dryococelus australis TaxID=614101 RepID=A0ABQ9I296_9NEOP|nr:hypothetical protein PR048_010286 [Dryococelus australis]